MIVTILRCRSQNNYAGDDFQDVGDTNIVQNRSPTIQTCLRNKSSPTLKQNITVYFIFSNEFAAVESNKNNKSVCRN